MNQSAPTLFRSPQLGRTRSRNRKRNQKLRLRQAEYAHPIYEKFLQILSKKRRIFLKQRLTQYYGKNFPINYKDHYNFIEQWENNRSSEQKTIGNYINQSNKIEVLMAISTTLVYFFAVWFTTIAVFFKNGGEIMFDNEVYTLTMITIIINMAFKWSQLKNKAQVSYSLIEFLKSELLSLNTILYLILKLANANDNTFFLWIGFECVVLVFLYKQASKRYQCFRLMSFSLQYEYQTKVFDLIITIFIIAHFIAIVLFSTTKVSPDSNWMTPLNIDPSQYFTEYIYSFYFTTTTILTVGYGDILPRNPFEVFVVIMVQVFGIAMLGYVINQIGYCISSLRKSRELIERDLTTVEKLKKHYKMSPNLTQKVRSYLMNSKPDINQLSPEEEKAIMLKVNEDIRMDMMKQNMLSVVKSSIFFVCRWSYSFQQSISNKLVHVLFNPNDVLYQPHNRERIYIIKSGKVSIHVSRILGNKKFKKSLKTIASTLDKDVSDNCYGYTAAISTRCVKLFGISKEFTSAYYIEKDKFLQSVNEKIPDAQFYHQIKNRIDQARFCESFQVPSLQSSKHHYNPTKYYIIRKYCQPEPNKSMRRSIMRRSSDHFRGRKFKFDQQMIDQIRRCFQGSFSSCDTNMYQDTEMVEQRKFTLKVASDSSELCKFVIENNLNANFHHYFQSSKEYFNYFSKCNKSHILKRLETGQYLHYSKNLNIQSNVRETQIDL